MQHNFHLSLLVEAVAVMCPSSLWSCVSITLNTWDGIYIDVVKFGKYRLPYHLSIHQSVCLAIHLSSLFSTHPPISSFHALDICPSIWLFIRPSHSSIPFNHLTHFAYLISARYSSVLLIMSSSGRMRLIFIKNLLNISLFILKIMAWRTSLFLFYRWEIQGTKKLNNCPWSFS